jgi:hypothetical protein
MAAIRYSMATAAAAAGVLGCFGAKIAHGRLMGAAGTVT